MDVNAPVTNQSAKPPVAVLEPPRWANRRLGLALILLLSGAWIVLIAASWAEAAELPADLAAREPASAGEPARGIASADDDAIAPPRADDSYDFNWLDPDKKIYVLQNRRYLKRYRPMLTLMGGPNFSSAYRTAYNLDPRLAFYVSEQFGVEAFATLTFNSENSTYKALLAASPNAIPRVREIRQQLGGLVHWAPWYAKINVFNSIVYFDWYFSAGAGVMNTAVDFRADRASPHNYQMKSVPAFYWGTGQLFHISQRWKARLDLTVGNYNAPINGADGETSWYSNYNLNAGIAFAL